MTTVDSPGVKKVSEREFLNQWQADFTLNPFVWPVPAKPAKKITVYVAGPYTRPDPVENTHKTMKVADTLVEMGYVPFIPHLTLAWHLVSPKPYDFWLDYDLVWMRKCDCLLRLLGDSSGADAEVVEALLLGMPVFYSIEELEKHYSGRGAK